MPAMIHRIDVPLGILELSDELPAITHPGQPNLGRALNPLSKRARAPKSIDASDLPTVALLHGFTGNKDSFLALRRGLCRRGFRVVSFDLPFHGGSKITVDDAQISLRRCAEAIVHALERLKVQQFALLGYSMGGRIALATALFYPERVSRLVLESASPGIEDERERAQRRAADEELAKFVEQNGVEAFVERWEKMPIFASLASLPESRRLPLRQIRLSCRPDALARALRTLGQGAQPSLGDRLGELKAQTLAVAGELDRKYVAIAHELKQKIPNCEVAIIARAGHVPHLERPRKFLRVVAAFLSGKQEATSAVIENLGQKRSPTLA